MVLCGVLWWLLLVCGAMRLGVRVHLVCAGADAPTVVLQVPCKCHHRADHKQLAVEQATKGKRRCWWVCSVFWALQLTVICCLCAMPCCAQPNSLCLCHSVREPSRLHAGCPGGTSTCSKRSEHCSSGSILVQPCLACGCCHHRWPCCHRWRVVPAGWSSGILLECKTPWQLFHGVDPMARAYRR